jgi:hypothetical protein
MSSKFFTGAAHDKGELPFNPDEIKALVEGGEAAGRVASKSVDILLGQARKQLNEAGQARVRAIERHDRIIEARTKNVERLERQLEEIKKVPKRVPKKVPRKIVKKVPKKVGKKIGKKVPIPIPKKVVKKGSKKIGVKAVARPPENR